MRPCGWVTCGLCGYKVDVGLNWTGLWGSFISPHVPCGIPTFADYADAIEEKSRLSGHGLDPGTLCDLYMGYRWSVWVRVSSITASAYINFINQGVVFSE